MKKQDAIYICDACGKETVRIYKVYFTDENKTFFQYFEICVECENDRYRENKKQSGNGKLPMAWFRKWFKK